MSRLLKATPNIFPTMLCSDRRWPDEKLRRFEELKNEHVCFTISKLKFFFFNDHPSIYPFTHM